MVYLFLRPNTMSELNSASCHSTIACDETGPSITPRTLALFVSSCHMWNVQMSGCASCLRSLYSNSDSSLVWSVDASRDSPTTHPVVSVKHNLLNVSTVVASYVNDFYRCVIVYVLNYSLIGMLIEFQWIYVNKIICREIHLRIWNYVSLFICLKEILFVFTLCNILQLMSGHCQHVDFCVWGDSHEFLPFDQLKDSLVCFCRLLIV